LLGERATVGFGWEFCGDVELRHADVDRFDVFDAGRWPTLRVFAKKRVQPVSSCRLGKVANLLVVFEIAEELGYSISRMGVVHSALRSTVRPLDVIMMS
jgi:hypothetical protein